MTSHSQKSEDEFILKYFGAYKGALLEIGANDGKTLSNSLLLIEYAWQAYLLEPGTICSELFTLHKDNVNVHIYNYGIGEKEEIVTFYESGAHVKGGNDKGLVSSTDFNETVRWRNAGVEFTERNIQLVPFNEFWLNADKPTFDFISIDVEGCEWDVLKQIDLNAVKCNALCIEYNGDLSKQIVFRNYCYQFGLRLALWNNENLIFLR